MQVASPGTCCERSSTVHPPHHPNPPTPLSQQSFSSPHLDDALGLLKEDGLVVQRQRTRLAPLGQHTSRVACNTAAAARRERTGGSNGRQGACRGLGQRRTAQDSSLMRHSMAVGEARHGAKAGPGPPPCTAKDGTKEHTNNVHITQACAAEAQGADARDPTHLCWPPPLGCPAQ